VKRRMEAAPRLPMRTGAWSSFRVENLYMQDTASSPMNVDRRLVIAIDMLPMLCVLCVVLR